MKKLGNELSSPDYWKKVASDYVGVLEHTYHKHRLTVIRALIPDELYVRGKRIFDFGCGDAVHLVDFLQSGAHAEGVDIAGEMISEGHKRLTALGYDPQLARVGGVESMSQLPSLSFDALLSFNVLAYLTNEEESAFYREAARILKPGGFLLVTHSNELFDMFSLNRYTLEFFRRHLALDESCHARLASLLSKGHVPETPTVYNVRENPLSYRYKLASYGFEEIRQEFSNYHPAPPLLMNWDESVPGESCEISDKWEMLKKKIYPDTLEVPVEERWKLMFVCSTYASCSRKQNP